MGLVLLLAATACSSGTVAPERTTNPGAVPGGKLVVGITQPGSIDPSSAYETTGSLVTQTICEPLIQFDPATGAPKPGIAEFWQISDGGTHFVIRLRKDVRFHDGSVMTAGDVAYSLWRVASEDNASNVADRLQSVNGYLDVHGETGTDNAQARNNLLGISIINNFSFEVQLATPDADFIRVLGHLLASPVPKKAVEKDPDAFGRQPVCAGPYMLTQPWKPGDTTIKVVRFPGYYGGNGSYARGGRGYADEIEFRIFPDQASEVKAFEAGKLDVAHVPLSKVPDVRRSHAGDLVRGPNGVVQYVGLPNSESAMFDDSALRQAMAQALDRQSIVRNVYQGEWLPATGFVPPTVGGEFRPNACGSSARGTQPGKAGENAPNPEDLIDQFADLLSQQLATQVGQRGDDRITITKVGSQKVESMDDFAAAFRNYKPGQSVSVTYALGGIERTIEVKLTMPSMDLASARASLRGKAINLYFNDEYLNRPLAAAAASQWEAKLGLRVKLVPMTWDAYRTKGQGAQGFDGPFLESWSGAYQGADPYLVPLFGSAGIGKDNFSRYSNMRLDRSVERMAREATDPEDVTLGYQRVEAYLCRDMPMIPVAFGQSVYLIRRSQVDSATGRFVEAATGQPDLRDLFLKAR